MSGSPHGPRAKIEWAKKHFRDLDGEIGRFFKTRPYEVTSQVDRQSGDKLYLVSRVDPVPDEVALIAGDVVHNLRSALDLLVRQLVLSNGKAPSRRDAFPISDSEAEFKKPKTGGEAIVKGRISKDALQILQNVKPYKGGNDGLWQLHKLDIADKHRLLFTVGSSHRSATVPFSSFEIEPGTSPEMAEFLAAANKSMATLTGEMFWNLGDPQFPLQVGDELMRVDVSIAGKEHTEPQFRFDVALSEPEVVEGEAILETLGQLVSLTEETTELFVPLL